MPRYNTDFALSDDSDEDDPPHVKVGVGAGGPQPKFRNKNAGCDPRAMLWNRLPTFGDVSRSMEAGVEREAIARKVVDLWTAAGTLASSAVRRRWPR